MSIHVETPPAPATPPVDPFAATKCGGCIALCCRYFALEIDAPDEPEDFENLRWYLLHERTGLFIDDDTWYLQIFSTCRLLGPDNKCSDYENRPTICRQYSDESCDYDGVQSDRTFRTIEELEAYRDEWVAEYEAEQERERARRRRARARKKAGGKGGKAKSKSKSKGR